MRLVFLQSYLGSCCSFRVNPKLLSYAGTKDKRAVTQQRIALQRGRAEQVAKLNDRLRGMQVGDYAYEQKGLSLADSKGNHFRIALRDVQPQTPELLHNRLELLKEKGFLNYYGMQRFGTHQVGTHAVGIAMLADDWQKAFELIVGGMDDDSSETEDVTKEARRIWRETKDPQAALDLFPRQCSAERAVLTSYLKQSKQLKNIEKINFIQCIQSIPKNLRLMYVHAYQSRVWNEMASKRHVLFGQNLVVGDLVRTTGVDLEDTGNKSENMQVEMITEENHSKFSIFDLVLPLPGHSVQYPTNEILDEYKSFMGTDGFDPKKMERKIHETNLPGSYRNVYVKPRNVGGKEVWYDGEPDTLIDDNLPNNSQGSTLGFVVEFSLGSSQYATMALRELLKTETSSSFHSLLSQATKNEQLSEI
jgi:tRNA pseudouridine13 synthase